MTEDDEKRLAYARGLFDAGHGIFSGDTVGALLRLLDTERADRARLEKERESWRISAAELSREYLARATQAESALAAARERVGRLEAAAQPFRAFADVLQPGDDNGRPYYSWVYLPHTEDGELLLKDEPLDSTKIVGVSASWSGVPATLMWGLTLGDFKLLRAALTPETP